MKSFLIFIGGFVAGALAIFFFIIAFGLMFRGNSEHSLNSVNLNHLENKVQYIEVKGKNGYVTLHTDMPKDSVQILLGKPDEIDLNKRLNTYYENWGYKLKNQYISDLNVSFRDGYLESVRHQ